MRDANWEPLGRRTRPTTDCPRTHDECTEMIYDICTGTH
jgi:hypothetical protein